MRSGQREIDDNIKHHNDRIEGEKDVIDEVKRVSGHRTHNYNLKPRNWREISYTHVTVSNRGHLILRNQGGIYLPTKKFLYVGQAFDGSSVIQLIDSGGQFNIPFDCLIFI